MIIKQLFVFVFTKFALAIWPGKNLNTFANTGIMQSMLPPMAQQGGDTPVMYQ